MAEHKNKKSFVDEGIREYDYNKRHKHLEKGAGVEKHQKSGAKPASEETKTHIKKK